MISGFPILMQDKKKIVLIPQSHDEKGFPVSFDGVVTLPAPFDVAILGRKAKEMIRFCESTPFIKTGKVGPDVMKDNDNFLKNVTGYKNDRKLNDAGWKWASVTNMPGPGKNEPSTIKEKGIKISVQKFRKGHFIGFTTDPSFLLPLDCSDQELGETILKAFDAIATIRDK